MEDKTDIFGEFGIWVWGKSIPSDVDKCQEFMRMSPLGKYIEKLESRIQLLYKAVNEAKAQPKLSKERLIEIAESVPCNIHMLHKYGQDIAEALYNASNAQSNLTERSK